MNEVKPTPAMSPRLMLVLRAGLILSTFGWGISFLFTVEPWDKAVVRLYEMGATPIVYQPLLAYWLKMSSAVFGCIGLASAVCFVRASRMIDTIRLFVPLHLIVGGTLIWTSVENRLDPAIHKSFLLDIAFCFAVAAMVGIPLAIQARRTRSV